MTSPILGVDAGGGFELVHCLVCARPEEIASPCYSFPGRIYDMEDALSIESITQQVKAEISKLTQVLRLLEGGSKPAKKQGSPRRKMSAAGRRRIATAQRARWAKVRARK